MVKSLEHLSSAQLRYYRAGNFLVTSDEGRAIEAHLEDCADCRALLPGHQRARLAPPADAAMETTPKAGPDSRETTCNAPNGPTEDDLRRLAAGIVDQEKAVEFTQHAAQCPRCGPVLRAFSEDFSNEVTQEEAEALGQLKSSTAEWQKDLLRKLLPPK